MKFWLKVLQEFDPKFYNDKVSICHFIRTSIIAICVCIFILFLITSVLGSLLLILVGFISILLDMSGFIDPDLLATSSLAFIITMILLLVTYPFCRKDFIRSFPKYGKFIREGDTKNKPINPSIFSDMWESISKKTCFYIDLDKYK